MINISKFIPNQESTVLCLQIMQILVRYQISCFLGIFVYSLQPTTTRKIKQIKNNYIKSCKKFTILLWKKNNHSLQCIGMFF